MGSLEYWQDKYPYVKDRINYIFLNKLFTDFVLIAKDNDLSKEFALHKVFLATASPYFESALFGPLSKNTNSMKLDDVDIDAVELLISFIYTDEIHLENVTLAVNVYHLADRFLMENLKQRCIDYISKNVDAKSVLEINEIFRIHQNELVLSSCQKVIKSNTTAIILSKEFEEISKETLLTILQEDKLSIKSEIQLYKAVERWFEAEVIKQELTQESEKKNLYYEVVENIRFCSMSPDEFPHSTLLSKYMDDEDKQKIINCLSSRCGVPSLPKNFSQKKRECSLSSPLPKVSGISNPEGLPHDWKLRLHASVARGDLRSLKKLIRAGADLKIRYNKQGTTLLHIAAHRRLEVVSCLVDNGIPLNMMDSRGYTALHIAALWGKADIVQLLLERGADPFLANSEGETPLDIANSQPHPIYRDIRDLLFSRM